MVYSVDNPTSLKNIRSKWFPEVMHHCGSIPTILVGTKTDLRDDPEAVERRSKQGKRLVDPQEVQQLAEELGCIAYIDCSALRGYNVDHVFQTALRHVLQKRGLLGDGEDTKCMGCSIM
jgi:GTPase SAR1 family protein